MLTFDRIQVNDNISLTEIRESDLPAYVELLSEREIYERTVRIPYPYTQKDAESWIQSTGDHRKQGLFGEWAIRNAEGNLIGGVGFAEPFRIGQTHKAEIGYWLAKPHWSRGIMTEAVKKLCDLAFTDLGLVRITAHIFDFNLASERVLEKCGFQLEGHLKKHFLKDGKHFDGKLYAKVV